MILKYKADLEKEFKESIVVFSAEWSKKSREQLESLSLLKTEVPIIECNVEADDASANFAIQNKIVWLPSLIIFAGGIEVSRHEGILNLESLYGFINSNTSTEDFKEPKLSLITKLTKLLKGKTRL
jgi:thioredoxin-like negative regulator of GroEL